ncbi:signal transduction histidine kinase [Lipingzhangella halophila]|uniref:histidine kinase n=1 Tax=Lipingzhangella halophila TaxID=1783352 RepID=A0A7W7W160_9ACTN|nr:sensor histidine kinase [Lipingzhangella halophila]MBB4929983.1 signal transduction histidine kinase [Lipingzhangella halophila]
MSALLRRAGADLVYLLSSFPIALIGFVLLVPTFAAGVGTLPIGIGIAVLALSLLIARGFAEVERRSLPAVLGHPVARPHYPRTPQDAGVLRRLTTPLRAGQSWLDLLYGVLILPVSVITFAVSVAFSGAALLAITRPLYGWIIRRAVGEDYTDLPRLLGLPNTNLADSLFYLAIGLVLALLLPFVLRGCALLRAQLGRVLLTSVGEMQERIADLSESRAAAVSAEAGALRRLERDIHDGPQQRLVHLAMELSRVKRQMERDPDAARDTLTSAIGDTRETLDELRALSRGIAPPVLTDRGLAPALAALAARCPVPVTVDTQVEERFPAAVESTIYFVAAECLTNMAKHSTASAAKVVLSRTRNGLLLTLGDNGVGGAHLAKGHGLAGLADRVKAVEGELVVDSPEGGPTVVAVEVPCA